MTLKLFVRKSSARTHWYEWWIKDADTGRELDRGGASKQLVAREQAQRALSACEQRLGDDRPTELEEEEKPVEETAKEKK